MLRNSEKTDSRPPNGYEKLINLNETWSESLKQLSKEGLTKFALLGGAKLISSFLIEDLIDELQITITPQLIGGSYCWVSFELGNLQPLTKKNSWTLKESKSLGNSELMIRYIRDKAN